MKSHQICERIWNQRAYQRADVIYAYLAKRGEVLLDELIENAWCQGKKVAVPKVLGADMRFYEIDNLEEVQESRMGIREPISEKTVRGQRPLILMPAVALDAQMHRVGHGGGYYDRYLEQNQMPLKVAVAFDFQIYPRVPSEAFDVMADVIVTESRIMG